MAIPVGPKQRVSSEELLMSKILSQEAIIRLLVEKGIFSKKKFWGVVRVVDQEIKGKGGIG